MKKEVFEEIILRAMEIIEAPVCLSDNYSCNAIDKAYDEIFKTSYSSFFSNDRSPISKDFWNVFSNGSAYTFNDMFIGIEKPDDMKNFRLNALSAYLAHSIQFGIYRRF